jgi:hypothetical protein
MRAQLLPRGGDRDTRLAGQPSDAASDDCRVSVHDGRQRSESRSLWNSCSPRGLRMLLLLIPFCTHEIVLGRREQVRVVAIDEDANRCSPQCLGGRQSRESATDDDDDWCSIAHGQRLSKVTANVPRHTKCHVSTADMQARAWPAASEQTLVRVQGQIPLATREKAARNGRIVSGTSCHFSPRTPRGDALRSNDA